MENENSKIIDFYSGYEGDPKIIMETSENGRTISLQIWDGYFRDIFDNVPSGSEEWLGFNRDYQQKRNAFGPDHPIVKLDDVHEYLADAEANAAKGIDYAETREVAKNVIGLLKFAEENHLAVTVHVE